MMGSDSCNARENAEGSFDSNKLMPHKVVTGGTKPPKKVEYISLSDIDVDASRLDRPKTKAGLLEDSDSADKNRSSKRHASYDSFLYDSRQEEEEEEDEDESKRDDEDENENEPDDEEVDEEVDDSDF